MTSHWLNVTSIYLIDPLNFQQHTNSPFSSTIVLKYKKCRLRLEYLLFLIWEHDNFMVQKKPRNQVLPPCLLTTQGEITWGNLSWCLFSTLKISKWDIIIGFILWCDSSYFSMKRHIPCRKYFFHSQTLLCAWRILANS